jgi:hypothetical protein
MKLKFLKTHLMKQLLFSSIVVFFSFSVCSQTNSFIYNKETIPLNSKIVEHYSNEFIQNLKENNVDLLLYLNYYVEFSYELKDISLKSKENSYKKVSDLIRLEKSLAPEYVKTNFNSFNILAYDLSLQNSQQVILAESGSYAFIIKSKEKFMIQFNEFRSQLLK